MADGEVQPTRIDAEEYARFKQWVQDTHGKTRGHLSTEIENALRAYREDANSSDKLTRIESDLATLKAAVVEDVADGGEVAPAVSEDYTRARADGPPEPNAPRSEKVDWIIEEYYNHEEGSTTRQAIQSQVGEEFGFGERTRREYTDMILEELDAEEHPTSPNVWAWGDTLEQAWQEVDSERE